MNVVGINLLPQARTTEKNKLLILIVFAIAIFTLAGLSVFYYLDTRSNVTELSVTITNKTELSDSLLAEYQSMTNGLTEYNFVDEYQEVYTFLNQIYSGTIDLQTNLLDYLPQGAEVQSYNYQNSGSLTMSIDFPFKSDAALYLNQLLSTEFITSAQITSISTIAGTNNYQTNIELTLKTLEGGE